MRRVDPAVIRANRASAAVVLVALGMPSYWVYLSTTATVLALLACRSVWSSAGPA